MKLIALISILLMSSVTAFAGSKHIIPADKEKISRHVGESVVVECKKLSPFSTNCQVDCGNGRHFRKAKGYCYYLTKGVYSLKVSTRHRGRDYKHTATVSILDNIKTSERPIRAIAKKKATRALSPVEPQHQHQIASIHQKGRVNLSPSLVSKPIDSFSNDVLNKNLNEHNVDNIPAVDPISTAGGFQQNNVEISVTDANENLFGNQVGVEGVNNNFNQNSISPSGGVGLGSGAGIGTGTGINAGFDVNSGNVNNQNSFQEQFVQRP